MYVFEKHQFVFSKFRRIFAFAPHIWNSWSFNNMLFSITISIGIRSSMHEIILTLAFREILQELFCNLNNSKITPTNCSRILTTHIWIYILNCNLYLITSGWRVYNFGSILHYIFIVVYEPSPTFTIRRYSQSDMLKTDECSHHGKLVELSAVTQPGKTRWL